MVACNESAACTARAIIRCPCGLRQQEVKCLASGSNPTPSRPEIKCDEECLRLERNRRLAAALNVDTSSHVNDHVPYSDTTLRLFKDNLAWAEAQEREFRVFARSANEVRMRYKPMASAYRQFLHALAEDYGLESKSEDVEPHRYAVVYKGSRFVSAPSKTLAQCIKIRAEQAAEELAAAVASRPPNSPPRPDNDPLNSLLLTSARFGLTAEEVNAALAGDLASQPSIHFVISFLPSEEVLMQATASYSAFLSPAAMEQALVNLRPRIAKTVERTGVAGNVLVCHVDSSSHISRRDDFCKKDGSGWSAVAGRAAAKLESARAAEEAPVKSGGRKLLGLRRKKPEKEQGRPWDALGGDVEC